MALKAADLWKVWAGGLENSHRGPVARVGPFCQNGFGAAWQGCENLERLRAFGLDCWCLTSSEKSMPHSCSACSRAQQAAD